MDMDQLRSDLECVAQQRALPDGQTLSLVLKRLDSLAGQANVPERLQHYLAKRSYVKALEWLDHPEMPHKR